MTYSIDFRRKVFAIKEKEGLSFEQASKRFGIGKTTLVRWTKKLEPELSRNKPATKINMDTTKNFFINTLVVMLWLRVRIKRFVMNGQYFL